MPESPEVKLTVEFLNKSLQNKKITNWIFCGGQYADDDPKGFDEFDMSLPLTVQEVKCKGKFIYFILSDDDGDEHYILHHLMMTGRWQHVYDKNCKWFIEIDNDKTLWFRDPRAFATLEFTLEKSVLTEKLDTLGPDILTEEFKFSYFKKSAAKYKRRNITSFLMDQSIISGCGNYIKAEVLYDAKISPMRKVGNLSDNELERVFQALRVIPRISYTNKGLSLGEYLDENGNPGLHDQDLKIYGKRWAKKTATSDGRTTYWDPERQV